MSEVQWLFVVLAALYGRGCACWVRRGSVVFSTWLGRNWRARQPGTLLGNQHGGFLFAAPLPPLGTLLTARQLPFSLSPDGVLAYVATNLSPGWRPAQSATFLRFDEVREVTTQGKKLLVNGEVLLTTESTGLLRYLADALRRLVESAPAGRDTVIAEVIRATLDSKIVAQRWSELQKLSQRVRRLGNLLFVYLFVFAPGLIWQLGFKLSWVGLLIGLLALTTATAGYFFRAHRRLYPQAEDERFTHTLTITDAPMATVRAHDALSRPLFETVHPLIVAKEFLSDANFRDFARRLLLDLRHPAEPICPSAHPGARATELHARTTLQTAVEDLLRQNGVEPDELCRPPSSLDESCRSYCPRCETQFTTISGYCVDCGGLALVAFTSAK